MGLIDGQKRHVAPQAPALQALPEAARPRRTSSPQRCL